MKMYVFIENQSVRRYPNINNSRWDYKRFLYSSCCIYFYKVIILFI